MHFSSKIRTTITKPANVLIFGRKYTKRVWIVVAV